MGVFSFIGKAATGAAAAAATTVGGVATAVGGVATAVGGVATAVGGIVTAVGSVATAVGARVAEGGTKIAASRSSINKYTEDTDEAEHCGSEQDCKYTTNDGNAQATQDLQVLLEKNEKLRFGMFAMALYVARLDGEDDTELDYIRECLGNEDLIKEEVKQEFHVISNGQYSFNEIKDLYLDDVSAEEMFYIDEVIKGVMDADGNVSEKEREFYLTCWQPYLRSLTKL